MPYIAFFHKTYGAMTTVPEYWIDEKIQIFDAVDNGGNTYPVQKSDCSSPKYIEE